MNPTLTVQNGYDNHTHPDESWTLPAVAAERTRPLRFGRKPGDPRDINIEIGVTFSRHMGSFVFDQGLWWLVVPIHDPEHESPKAPLTIRFLNRSAVATLSEGSWLALGPGDQGRIDFISTEPTQAGWLEFTVTVTDQDQDIPAVTAPPAVENERLDRRHLLRGAAVSDAALVAQHGTTQAPVGMAPADRDRLIVASWFAWDDPFGPFLSPRQVAWVLKDLDDKWSDDLDDNAKAAYLNRTTGLASDSLNQSVNTWSVKMDRKMNEEGIDARMTAWPNLPTWRTSRRYTIQWLRAWRVLTDDHRRDIADKLGGPPFGGTYPREGGNGGMD